MDTFLQISRQSTLGFCDGGKLVATTPFVHADRKNSDYVMMMGIAGHMQLQVEARPMALDPREILIIPPGTRHIGTQPSERLIYIWCHFQVGGPVRQLPIGQLQELCTRMHLKEAPGDEGAMLLPLQFAPPCPSRLLVLLQQILDASRRGYHSGGVTDSLLAALLHEMTEQTITSFYSRQAVKESMRFTEIAEWIRINAFRSISVGDVADRFLYNPNYISGLFHKKTGYSLGQYIINTKMELAKEFLLTTDWTVKEIADQLAFNDPRYFMRCFKKHESLTPTEYRNTNSETMINTRWLPHLIKEE